MLDVDLLRNTSAIKFANDELDRSIFTEVGEVKLVTSATWFVVSKDSHCITCLT